VHHAALDEDPTPTDIQSRRTHNQRGLPRASFCRTNPRHQPIIQLIPSRLRRYPKQPIDASMTTPPHQDQIVNGPGFEMLDTSPQAY
jgi:hypothetical protein